MRSKRTEEETIDVVLLDVVPDIIKNVVADWTMVNYCKFGKAVEEDETKEKLVGLFMPENQGKVVNGREIYYRCWQVFDKKLPDINSRAMDQTLAPIRLAVSQYLSTYKCNKFDLGFFSCQIPFEVFPVVYDIFKGCRLEFSPLDPEDFEYQSVEMSQCLNVPKFSRGQEEKVFVSFRANRMAGELKIGLRDEEKLPLSFTIKKAIGRDHPTSDHIGVATLPLPHTGQKVSYVIDIEERAIEYHIHCLF